LAQAQKAERAQLSPTDVSPSSHSPNEILPRQQAAGRSGHALAQNADQNSRQSGNQKTIKAIHHTAMTRNEVTCVFDAKSPLDGGLEEVATLRDY
jgi:hypothetical protein